MPEDETEFPDAETGTERPDDEVDFEDLYPAQEGPQQMFRKTKADIAIFGGAAGGGKSWSLLTEPLRHVDNGEFGAVIFRRTHPEITNEGGLWDESQKLYPLLRAKQAGHSWEFDSGASITFGAIQLEKDVFKWKSSQICYLAFDEVNSFTEKQFWYMLSRNRSTCGIKPYVRATTNPDADSWVAELLAWWIDQDTGYPIPERAGVLRWFVRVDDVLVWGDSAKELKDKIPGSRPKSLTFIPAKLEDNKILERQDADYRANLMALPTVDRMRLLEGNWKVRATAGMFFKPERIGILDYVPTVTRQVRGWDLAATDGAGDWTAGIKWGLQSNGRYVILDAKVGQWETGTRDATIRQTADLDGLECHQRLPQDPGQAGKAQVHHFARMLDGCNWSSDVVIGDKRTRASGMCSAMNSGNVDMVRADWNQRLLDRFDRFPDKNVPDDEIDASSDAYNLIANGNWIEDDTTTGYAAV